MFATETDQNRTRDGCRRLVQSLRNREEAWRTKLHETGFFRCLADRCGFERFAWFNVPARQAPGWLLVAFSAVSEQHGSVRMDDDCPDSNRR
jgi:hypothetical protein